MQVTKCHIENFASYKELEFDFSDSGLALLHGATGSGKSTLCDIIPWVLFGTTAKGGAVSDILSWPGNEVTKATVWLDTVTISRSRGPKAKDNDLSFWPVDGSVTRGKDLNDTQKLINQFLGIDANLYLSGAYFHEFSQTAQFFTTTAKNRRSICEQLVDLSLPKKLQEKNKEAIKIVEDKQIKLQHEKSLAEANLRMLLSLQEQENSKANAWGISKESRLSFASNNVLRFETHRNNRIDQAVRAASIKAKSKICSECGAAKTAENHARHDNIEEIKRIEKEENPYIAQLKMIEAEVNPHSGTVKDFSKDIKSKKVLIAICDEQLNAQQTQWCDLDILNDLVQDFRGLLIKNTILDVEAKTNVLLSTHFDAEIKIELSVEDADKLEVVITKDGNTCNYTQLSKGQRQLLKLCFGVAVMQAISNHHGIEFKQVFFDESTDGVDDTNKIKAIKMLETLALDKGVYVVEHSSEVKALIDTKYKVELVNGNSEINAEA